MSARELRDWMTKETDGPITINRPSGDYATILSALSLAAAVEESGEEVVRALGRTQMMLNIASQYLHAENVERAAALLVARSQEIERLKELDRLAEAMHKWIDRVLSWAERGEQDIGGEELGAIIPDGGPIYEAYRAAKGMP